MDAFNNNIQSAPSFNSRVYAVVRLIPTGKVLTYGRVAALIDVPRGARAVGWAMSAVGNSTHTADVPWFRVVNSAGRISIRSSHYFDPAQEQRRRLEAEGVQFDEHDPLKILNFNAILWTLTSLAVQAMFAERSTHGHDQ